MPDSEDYDYWPSGCKFDKVRNIKHEPEMNFYLFLTTPVIPREYNKVMEEKIEISDKDPLVVKLETPSVIKIESNDSKDLISNQNFVKSEEISIEKMQLRIHDKISHAEIEYECEHCEKTFTSRPALTRHVDFCDKTPTKNLKHYRCKKCSRSFSFKENFERHWRSHSLPSQRLKCKNPWESKCHPCEFCPKVYLYKGGLRRHIDFIHSLKMENFHRCKICTNSFYYKENLQNHLNSHKHLKNSQKFVTKSSVSKNGKYKCKYCGADFVFQFSLREHIDNKHNKLSRSAGDYKCELCKMTFKYRRNFERHVKTHSGQFKCELCGKSYLHRISLLQHIDLKHSLQGDTRYKCTRCCASFKFKRNHRRHMRSLCKKFSKPNEERKLQCKNYYQCKMCSESFRFKENHQNHIRTHQTQAKRLPCDQCKYKSLSQRNLRDHKDFFHQTKPYSQNNRYACTKCPRSYNYKRNLNRHETTHK